VDLPNYLLNMWFSISNPLAISYVTLPEGKPRMGIYNFNLFWPELDRHGYIMEYLYLININYT